MQSVVASTRSNGSNGTVSTLSQANTGNGGVLTEHDYIGLSEASSSSQTCEYHPQRAKELQAQRFGEADLKLGLSLTAPSGSYGRDNLGYSREKGFHQSQSGCQWGCQDGGERSYPPVKVSDRRVSQEEYQWCGGNQQGGGWPRAFEHWVPQDRSSPGPQSAWQGQVLRGREGARILTAQDLQPPPPPSPSGPSVPRDVAEGLRAGYCFPGRVLVPAMAGTKRVHNESVESDGLQGSSAIPKGQVVGWPPIRSYRKNTLAAQPKPAGDGQEEDVAAATKSVQNQGNSLYVKVNMDGVPIGRKVDLNVHDSYEALARALEEMFHRSTSNCQSGAQAPMEKGHGVASDSKPSRLLDSSSEYVLTYEDKEGDWMLVGDVPWRMFVNSVKRLRIMKTSEANGLAPGCSEKMNRQKNKAV